MAAPSIYEFDAESQMPARFQPLAMVLAWVFPGLGHWYLGMRQRAWRIALGVLGLIAVGVLVAGIDAVDGGQLYMPRETRDGKPVITTSDREVAQVVGMLFAGPVVIAIDQVHQRRFKVLEDGFAGPGRNVPVIIRRNAHPWEIRDPATGKPIAVRDGDGSPMNFVDPSTRQTRLSTPADRPPNIPALARIREIGGLFACLAGMLNLIAMVDAAFARRRTVDPDHPAIRAALRAREQTSGGGAA
ncbi:MAG: hypothetical protein MUE97_02605 [Phycisphaerales bacterium]|nr:hypothetical protein [Phycisphaerales bacterium]